MKKILITIISICFCISILTGCSKEQTEDSPNENIPTPTINASEIVFDQLKFDTATNSIVGLSDSADGLTDIVIPGEINGYEVLAIAPYAFQNSNLTSVVLPDTVTTIGSYAFENNSLAEISLSENLLVIEAGAFSNNNLTEVTIPKNITVIELGVFRGNELTAINLPDSITTIKRSAFKDNKIQEVIFPSSLKVIESNSFQQNELTKVVFNEGLEKIDGMAFKSNELTSIILPATVTALGEPTPDAKPVNYYEKYTFANNQITKITILGSGVEINSFLLADNNHFRNVYTEKGPGTYTGTQAGTWEKTN